MSENREILKEEKQWLIVGLLGLVTILFLIFAYTVFYFAFEKADELKKPVQTNSAQRKGDRFLWNF